MANIAAAFVKVAPLFKHIIRFVGLFLVMHVFILTAHADDMDNAGFAVEQGIPTISQAHSGQHLSAHHNKHSRQTKILPEHHHNKRFQIGKHISVQLFLPKTTEHFSWSFYESINHTSAAPKHYRYIYFKEINPPPPKAC